MSQFKLILTTDYEVWGNGSGDVRSCMIEPTARMLDICDKHGAKLTIFLDLMEYWAFEKAESDGLFSKEYQPASLIRQQLKDAVKRGHDVQMHLHPQWIDAVFKSDFNWQVDMKYWRLPEFLKRPDGRKELNEIFQRGRTTLEELLTSENSDYSANVFRAGAWSIQPERELLGILASNGIAIDSTAAPGMLFDDGLTYYDFRKAPLDRSKWMIKENVIEEDTNGDLLEIPIATAKFSGMTNFFFTLRKFLNVKNAELVTCEKKVEGKSKRPRRKGLFEYLKSGFRMLNFSDGTSEGEMKSICRKVMDRHEDERNSLHPIVAISHPKTFYNPGEMDNFLKWSATQETISFGTFQDFI